MMSLSSTAEDIINGDADVPGNGAQVAHSPAISQAPVRYEELGEINSDRLVELFEMAQREKNQFVSRDKLALELLLFNRNWQVPDSRDDWNRTATKLLSTIFPWFHFDMNRIRLVYPGFSSGSVECEQWRQLQKVKCNSIVAFCKSASKYPTAPGRDNGGILWRNVSKLPGRLEEGVSSFVAAHQLDTTYHQFMLSATISSIELLLETYLSIPKLAPFFLPLAETRTVHNLSDFRPYLIGLKLLPSDTSCSTSSKKKSMFSSEAEAYEYERSVLLCVHFIADTVFAILDSIPASFVPPSGCEGQDRIGGLVKKEFAELFTLIASADLSNPERNERFRTLFFALFRMDKETEVATMSFYVSNSGAPLPEGRQHKSILDVLRIGRDGEDGNGESTLNFESCDVTDLPRSPDFPDMQDSEWNIIIHQLESLSALTTSTERFLSDCSNLLAESQLETQAEDAEEYNSISHMLYRILLSVRYRFNRSAIQSISAIKTLQARGSAHHLAAPFASEVGRYLNQTLFFDAIHLCMRIQYLPGSWVLKREYRGNRKDAAAAFAREIPEIIYNHFGEIDVLLSLARIHMYCNWMCSHHPTIAWNHPTYTTCKVGETDVSPSLLQLFETASHPALPFFNRDGVTLKLLHYCRDTLHADYQSKGGILLRRLLKQRFWWLKIDENNPGKSPSELDDHEYHRVLSRCRTRCEKAFDNASDLMSGNSSGRCGLDNRPILGWSTKDLPRDVAEGTSNFVTECQLDLLHRLSCLSDTISQLEDVLETCLSTPTLRPLLLPLAETETVHLLSEFRADLLGLTSFPSSVSSSTASTRGRRLSTEAELDEYAASASCCLHFLLHVAKTILDSIPHSLLLPIQEEDGGQTFILGLDKSEFQELVTVIASVNFGNAERKKRIIELHSALFKNCKGEMKSSIVLGYCDTEKRESQARHHRSICEFWQRDTGWEMTCQHVAANCPSVVRCSSTPPPRCHNCRSQLLIAWYCASHAFDDLSALCDHTWNFLDAILTSYASSCPLSPPEEVHASCSITLLLAEILRCTDRRFSREMLYLLRRFFNYRAERSIGFARHVNDLQTKHITDLWFILTVSTLQSKGSREYLCLEPKSRIDRKVAATALTKQVFKTINHIRTILDCLTFFVKSETVILEIVHESPYWHIRGDD